MAEVKVWYDQAGDFLEMIFDDAPASFEEVSDDVFERRTPDGRIIGFAIFNFSKHDRQTINLPLAIQASLVLPNFQIHQFDLRGILYYKIFQD